MTIGTVYLVGAGPGDPDLITLKAVKALQLADVVFIDNLANNAVLEHCPSDVRVVDVGKIPNGRSVSQEVTNALLVKEARLGHTVVRLKGGDPFVFGRGGEEAIFLRERDIPFEIVPGISSAIAVPASANIPVTHRGVTTHFTVCTGVGATLDALKGSWRQIGALGGTAVFLMGVRRASLITAELIAAGRSPDTPAAFIYSGTNTEQLTLRSTLSEIADKAVSEGIKPPAILVVGEVVSIGDAISGLNQYLAKAAG